MHIMCIDKCIDMCTDMCIDMCIDMYMDMCVDMCIDMVQARVFMMRTSADHDLFEGYVFHVYTVRHTMQHRTLNKALH